MQSILATQYSMNLSSVYSVDHPHGSFHYDFCLFFGICLI